MPDLSEIPTEQLKARLKPSTPAGGLAGVSTEQLKAKMGGAAQQVKGAASQAMTAYERDVLGKDRDIDYSSSAPFSVRVMVERASNPNEVQLELGKYYQPSDFGQDTGGRWWVREGGKKVPVQASGIGGAFSNFGAKMVAGGAPMAGSVVGGALGIPGGPFGIAAGTGLGAAAGMGLDELMKVVRGTYAKTPSETARELSGEAALNMGLVGGGQVVRQIAPAIKSKIFGVTPQTGAQAERLIERGAIPPIGSVAPEATGFEAKRKLRNIVSGDPTAPGNVAYVDREVRRMMKSSGMTEDQVNTAMEQAVAGRVALARSDPGQSIVSAAQRTVQQAEQSINQNLADARKILSANEGTLRAYAAPSARLGQDVADTIVGARRSFGQTMRQAYTQIHNLTGDRPVVNIGPAINEARQIVAMMPEGSVPGLIRNLVDKNQAIVSIEEAHNLRSSLRDAANMANLPNLTPDQSYALFSRVEGAVDEAFDVLAKSGAGLPQEAAKMLAKTDAAYREGIAKFKDATLNKLVRDAKSGLIPNPEVVAQTIMREGSLDRTKEVLRMVSPEVRDQIQRADMRNVLSRSSFLDENGQLRLNGKDLLAELNKRNQSMELLYGKQFMDRMGVYAKELAAADGDIPVSALSHPTQVSDALRRWAMDKDVLDKFVKENPLGALRSGEPRSIDRALVTISRPGDTATTETAMKALNPQERQTVQRFNLKRVISAAMEESTAGIRQVSGSSIERELSKYTERQQDLLFPYGMAADLRELARDLKFMFPTPGGYAESVTSMGVKSRGFFNPFGLRKRIAWFLSGWFTDRPAVLHWFANLHAKDPNAARQVMGTMSRWIANAALTGPSGGKPNG